VCGCSLRLLLRSITYVLVGFDGKSGRREGSYHAVAEAVEDFV
jgi:hypothetical protein